MDIAKNLFICISMTIVSIALGFSAYAQLGLGTSEAIMVSVGLIAFQLVGYLFVWKAINYRALAVRMHELTLAEAENAHKTERVSNELQGLRKGFKTFVRQENEPLARELEVFGTLVKRLAENSSEVDARIAALEERMVALEARPSIVQPVPAASTTPPQAPPVAMPVAATPPVAMPADVSAQPTNDGSAAVQQPTVEPQTSDTPTLEEVIEAIEAPSGEESANNAANADDDIEHLNTPLVRAIQSAVDTNTVDIYLQPIVTLPQRKPKFYEALSRLRDAEGRPLRPAHYIPSAEQVGVMPVLDKMLLVRAVQILRRLMDRKAEAVIVCNISASSLADNEFFGDFKRLLTTRGTLANHMIFEFNQQTVKDLGPVEEESLRALKELGFSFSMDNVSDLSMDFRKLVPLGFHYIKVAAPVLLGARDKGIKDIHAEDFSRYLARMGVQLIVDQIETEGQVIDLLDYNVSFGQGFLFASPREVKPDLSQPRRKKPDERRLAS